MPGAGEPGQQVHLQARQPCPGQVAIEKTHPLPTAEHEAHQPQGERVRAKRLVGHLVLAVALPPIDDIAVHFVGFGHCQTQLRVAEHQQCNVEPCFEAIHPSHTISRADSRSQRLLVSGDKRPRPQRAALDRTQRDDRSEWIFHDRRVGGKIHIKSGPGVGHRQPPLECHAPTVDTGGNRHRL